MQLSSLSRNFNAFSVTPQPLQIVKCTSLFLENVTNQVTIIQKNPLAVIVAFKAHGQFAAILHLKVNLVADSLVLAGVGTGTDQEVIGKAGDLSEIKDNQIEGFLG